MRPVLAQAAPAHIIRLQRRLFVSVKRFLSVSGRRRSGMESVAIQATDSEAQSLRVITLSRWNNWIGKTKILDLNWICFFPWEKQKAVNNVVVHLSIRWLFDIRVHLILLNRLILRPSAWTGRQPITGTNNHSLHTSYFLLFIHRQLFMNAHIAPQKYCQTI